MRFPKKINKQPKKYKISFLVLNSESINLTKSLMIYGRQTKL